MGMRYLGGGVGHFTPAPIEKEDEAADLEEEPEVSGESVTHERFMDDPINEGWDEERVSDSDDEGDEDDEDESLGEEDEMLEEFIDV
jgi:hypothetical protein